MNEKTKTPLDYATDSRGPMSRGAPAGTAILWAVLLPATLMAGWLAFWNIGFEPIVGVVTAALFAAGVIYFVRALLNPRRRLSVITGGVVGTILVLILIGLMIAI